jgi:membrane protein YdbS with pleckstrin-like domain
MTIKKENIMKTESKKSSAGKIASLAIVAVVVAGAFAVSGVADVSEGSGLMGKVFVLFLGAVIALQVVPCLMLVAAMVKGVCSMVSKKISVPVTVGSK